MHDAERAAASHSTSHAATDDAQGQGPQQSWGAGRKILYLVTEDWYFCSHRLPIARAARDAGFEVVVVTRVEEHGERIRNEGFRLIALPWRRRSKNLWHEARSLASLHRIYRREKPDIAHHVALKPAVYGSLAAKLTGTRRVVNAVAGFGYIFTAGGPKARMLRRVFRWSFGNLMNHPEARVIVQNPDDRRTLARSGMIAPDRLATIRGSGVDVDVFVPGPEPDGAIRASMVSRMLWSKGVGELVDAARQLAKRRADLRIVLVGAPDPENPQSIPVDRLRAWRDEGIVEWAGSTGDVPAVWAGSHIAVLPSYREGLPKTLLEAAACGRPIVATNVPGCREIVRDGDNGLLVKVKDSTTLAEAIDRLASHGDLRRRMGARGREMVVESFAENIVVEDTMALYRSMLAPGGGA